MPTELIEQQHPFAALIDHMVMASNLACVAARLDVPESSIRNWSIRPGRIPGSPTLDRMKHFVRRMSVAEQMTLFEIVFEGTRLAVSVREPTYGRSVLEDLTRELIRQDANDALGRMLKAHTTLIRSDACASMGLSIELIELSEMVRGLAARVKVMR